MLLWTCFWAIGVERCMHLSLMVFFPRVSLSALGVSRIGDTGGAAVDLLGFSLISCWLPFLFRFLVPNGHFKQWSSMHEYNGSFMLILTNHQMT